MRSPTPQRAANGGTKPLIVVGAGLAGTLLVDALHRRGLRPRWLDAGPEARASTNPCALVQPFAGRSFLPKPHVFDAWARVRRFASSLGPSAHVHEARLERRLTGATGERLWASWQEHEGELRDRFDGEFELRVEPDGTRVIAYGPVVCLSLRGAVEDVQRRLSGAGLSPTRAAVRAIDREGSKWRLDLAASDTEGQSAVFAPTGKAGSIERAPHVVIAAGTGTRALLGAHLRPGALEHVEGTVGHAAAPALDRFVVDRGHVASTAARIAWGASYRRLDQDEASTHAEQLRAIAKRLAPHVPEWPERSEVWKGVRVVDPRARAPLVKELEPGLWCLTAFGSQGGLWIPWASERLAAMLEEALRT